MTSQDPNSALTEVNEDLSLAESCARHVCSLTSEIVASSARNLLKAVEKIGVWYMYLYKKNTYKNY